MSFLYNEIYDQIPNELLNTDGKAAVEFVSETIKASVPPNDYHPHEFSKTILPLTLHLHQRQKSLRRRKPYLTREEKNKLKLTKCPKTGWNYEEFESLRKMWEEYMLSHFNKNKFKKATAIEIERFDRNVVNAIFAKADYHGAEMKVVRSKNPSLVGLSGTCIMDTKSTFKIISKDNKCRTIPKQDCVFQINVGGELELTVYGKVCSFRSAERSIKKVKSLMIPDL